MNKPSATARTAAPTGSTWILNSWRDLILFVGTPLLILPLALSAQGRWSIEEISLFVASFGAMGHHLPGMMRAYGDRALFQRFKLRFIVAPVFLLAVCAVSGVLRLHGIYVIVFFWGIWHALMQTYGFLRIYDAKRGFFSSWTCRLDLALCIGWFGAAILWSPTRLPDILNTLYQSGAVLLSGSAIHAIRTVWTLGTGLCTVLFLARWVRDFRSGRSANPVKLLLMATSFAFFWYSNVFVRNMLLGIALFEIFHDVQYLALVWIYNRNRIQKDPGVGKFARFLFRPHANLVGVYVGLVFGYGALNLIPHQFPKGAMQEVLTAMLAASGLLHFYFDGFIWKVRESSTRRSLGMKEESRSPAETPPRAAWTLHGLKWGLLAVPVLVLGMAELKGSVPELERRRAVAEALPQSAAAQYDLGVALADAGLHEEAVSRYRRAVELWPGYPEANTRLGIALGADGRLEEAARHFLVALSTAPKDFEATNNLGVTLFLQGKHSDAVTQYERALRIEEESPETHYNLAVALESVGRREEAGAHYSRAIELRSDYSQARERLNRLQGR